MLDKDTPRLKSVLAWKELEAKRIQQAYDKNIGQLNNDNDKKLLKAISDVIRSAAKDLYGDINQEKYIYIIDTIMTRVRGALNTKLTELGEALTETSQTALNQQTKTLYKYITDDTINAFEKTLKSFDLKISQSEKNKIADLVITKINDENIDVFDEIKKVNIDAKTKLTSLATTIQYKVESDKIKEKARKLILSRINSTVDNITKQETKNIANITKKFAMTNNLVNTRMKKLENVVNDNIEEISSQVNSITSGNFLDGISFSLTGILTTALNTALKVVSWPIKLINKYIVQPVWNGIKWLSGQLIKPITWIWDKVCEFSSLITKSIGQTLMAALATPQGLFVVSFAASYIWNKWIKPLWNNITNWWNGISPIFDPIVEWFKGNNNFMDAIKNVAHNIWYGMPEHNIVGLKTVLSEFGTFLWSGKSNLFGTEWKGLKYYYEDYKFIPLPSFQLFGFSIGGGKASISEVLDKLWLFLKCWAGIAAAHYAASIITPFLPQRGCPGGKGPHGGKGTSGGKGSKRTGPIVNNKTNNKNDKSNTKRGKNPIVTTDNKNKDTGKTKTKKSTTTTTTKNKKGSKKGSKSKKGAKKWRNQKSNTPVNKPVPEAPKPVNTPKQTKTTPNKAPKTPKTPKSVKVPKKLKLPKIKAPGAVGLVLGGLALKDLNDSLNNAANLAKEGKKAQATVERMRAVSDVMSFTLPGYIASYALDPYLDHTNEMYDAIDEMEETFAESAMNGTLENITRLQKEQNAKLTEQQLREKKLAGLEELEKRLAYYDSEIATYDKYITKNNGFWNSLLSPGDIENAIQNRNDMLEYKTQALVKAGFSSISDFNRFKRQLEREKNEAKQKILEQQEQLKTLEQKRAEQIRELQQKADMSKDTKEQLDVLLKTVKDENEKTRAIVIKKNQTPMPIPMLWRDNPDGTREFSEYYKSPFESSEDGYIIAE